MKSTGLKWIRLGIALVSLLLFSAIFIDFRHLLPESLIKTGLYLQFAPSLLKFLATFSLASAGFFLVILLTALFGRVYCSAICPLGILQDGFTRISRLFRSKRKRRFGFRKPLNLVRYPLLALTVLFLLFGSTFVLNQLDPYSIFGRIYTYFFRPVAVGANNLLAGVLNDFNLYFIYRVDLYPVRTGLLVIPGVVLALVLVLSVTRGRLYCNTVCPVGAFLGLLSRYSLFRIRIEPSACTGCSLCEKACKAECIDYKSGTIDHTRCVMCFNCIGVCRESAISFSSVKSLKPAPVKQEENRSTAGGGRRRFILGSLAWILGLGGSLFAQKKTPVPKKASTVPESRTLPVCPPGSRGLEWFNDHCTACTLCVSVCPTSVLQPSFLEYGLAGLMQPRMDYHAGFCNFECVKCTEVCPTGAILPAALEDKKLIQIGKAVFIQDNCIVHTEKTDCGACSEHCPTKAVHMVPYEGNLVIPEVNDDICIGCGACEHACPTVPFKAIFVDGNSVHLQAEKPEEQEKATIDLEEEFPF